MRKRLQKALDLQGGLYSIEDIAVEVKAGRMQLFQNENGICIVSVLEFPQRKMLNVVAVVGTMDVIPTLQDEVEAFGRSQGCTRFYSEGRPGWTKVLTKFGWTSIGARSHMIKEL